MESNWKEQTRTTITRLRAILALNPQLSNEDRNKLLAQARLLTEAMRVDSSKFWGVYVNTVRILVALTTVDPLEDEMFDEDPVRLKPAKQKAR